MPFTLRFPRLPFAILVMFVMWGTLAAMPPSAQAATGACGHPATPASRMWW